VFACRHKVNISEQGKMPDVVVIEYADLADTKKDVSELIEKAYGPDGLGVLAIRNVPGFVAARNAALPLSHDLAHLDEDTLASLEDEKTVYQVGWSRGKEKIGDELDLSKGSFYFNPLSDMPGTPEDRAKWPLSYPLNIWPSKEVMPTLESALKTIGKIMHGVVVHVGRCVDELASKQMPRYNLKLGETLAVSEKAKGRLLYYYPLSEKEMNAARRDSWISVHNDSGFLTALAGELYLDENGNQVHCPDPAAGLYVIDRSGKEHHVIIPDDCMAVQVGECLQIVTGGVVQATPHYVRGASVRDKAIARVALPLFVDTKPSFPLVSPPGVTREEIVKGASKEVPPMGPRWTHDGQTFGDFLQQCVNVYYSLTPEQAAEVGEINRSPRSFVTRQSTKNTSSNL